MYRFPPSDSRRAPLDFDSPRRTDTVADALGPDPSDRDPFPVSDLDTGALLAEAGIPDHALRSIAASWAASEV